MSTRRPWLRAALIVGTDRNALYSFELGPPDSGRILTKLAEKPPDDKQPIVPFLASRFRAVAGQQRGNPLRRASVARGTCAEMD